MPRQTINHNVPSSIESNYVCALCDREVISFSSTVPSLYCTCDGVVGSRDFGGATQLLLTEQSLYYYDNTAVLFERPPISYASSNHSRDARGPEGPEKDIPNTQNSYLTIAPAPGPNEVQHRKTSFRSQMTYQMRRYIQDQQDAYEQAQRELQQQQQVVSYNTNHNQGQPRARFLPLDVYMSPASGRGSGKTKSWESEDSGGSVDRSLQTWETMPIDPVRGIGAWTAGEGVGLGIGRVDMERCRGDRYPMNMSEMTEALYDIDRR